MSISKFNFNMINHVDLRKFLSKKLETLKWEFSSAHEANLAHYKYNPPMAYNFVHTKNMKIIIKKVLREMNCEFILPFIYFNNRNMIRILEENAYFFNNGIFYFKCADGKREFMHQAVKTPEEIYRIMNSRYKESTDNFILEKSEKKMAMFESEIFDLRCYLLVVRIGKKYYTFLYPTVFANFNSSINKRNFLKSLGFIDFDEISGRLPLMKNIYNLIQKTATVLANYIELTGKISKLENDMKGIKNKNIDFQFNLYGVDIILDGEKNPYLSDIAMNPFFSLKLNDTKIIKEKIKIYNDILDNFVNAYDKTGKINHQKSDFILLNNIPQEAQYKWVISLKNDSELDDTIEYNLDEKNFITPQGETLVQSMIIENKDNLSTDNEELLSKIGLKPLANDKYIISESKLRIYEMENEYLTNAYKDLNYKNDDEDYIQSKLDNLYVNERRGRVKNSFIRLLGRTMPVIGLLYGAKMAYDEKMKL